MKITQKGIPFSEVKVWVKDELINVRFEFKAAEKPEDLEEKSNSYKYVEIKTSGIENENIEKVEIQFKVNKTWVSENNYSPENIYLFKYENGVWRKLKTEMVETTDKEYVYKSELSGFSVFAIAYEKPVEEKPKGEIEEKKPKKEKEEKPEEEKEEIVEEEKPEKKIWPYIAIFIIIVLAVVAYFIGKKMKK